MEAKVAFESVCEKISENYKETGWKYSKSKHWMTRKDKNFTYKVSFYTSWNNRSDEKVVFYGAFAIISNKNKQCYTAISTEDCNVPKDRLDWNVATEEVWNNTVKEFSEWLNTMCIPIMEECTNNLDEYIKNVVEKGFYPWMGYIINIDFILQFGTRKQAEEATKRYYDSLKDNIKLSFKKNYESMIYGGDAVDDYGSFKMLNPSEFRTIIENKIIVDLD